MITGTERNVYELSEPVRGFSATSDNCLIFKFQTGSSQLFDPGAGTLADCRSDGYLPDGKGVLHPLPRRGNGGRMKFIAVDETGTLFLDDKWTIYRRIADTIPSQPFLNCFKAGFTERPLFIIKDAIQGTGSSGAFVTAGRTGLDRMNGLACACSPYKYPDGGECTRYLFRWGARRLVGATEKGVYVFQSGDAGEPVHEKRIAVSEIRCIDVREEFLVINTADGFIRMRSNLETEFSAGIHACTESDHLQYTYDETTEMVSAMSYVRKEELLWTREIPTGETGLFLGIRMIADALVLVFEQIICLYR